MTVLATPLNQLATTLGSAHASASGTLVLAAGYGAAIAAELAAEGAPAISSSHPIRVSVVAAANIADVPIAAAHRTLFLATGLSGDSLTGCTAIEGTADRNYQAGDAVRFNLTAGSIVELQAAIASGADKNFVYAQSAPSATWNINHGLGKYPSVVVVDTANDLVFGDVHYVDVNNLTLAFSAPFSGAAYLN